MKSILDRALAAMRNAEVEPQQVEQAASRVLSNLKAEYNKVVPHPVMAERITSCADFQSLIPAYLSMSLTSSRALLVEDHIRECVACRKAAEAARNPRPARHIAQEKKTVQTRGFRIALAAAAMVVLAIGLTRVNVVRDFIWPIDVHAVAQTVDGNLFLVAGADIHSITAGDRIERNRTVRTGKDSGAVLQLGDGSKIEMRERSELSLNRANDGVKIHLDRGSVIVTAAKQRNGHLYVGTNDFTVSVVGTVFSVNAGSKGSRVSVIEGEVHVEHGSQSQALRSGQQIATNPVLGTVPVEQDIAWSRNAEAHTALLKELIALNTDLNKMLAKQELRYTSNLVGLAPANTVIFASLPNVTQSLSQAYEGFRQKLNENPALVTWWQPHSKDLDQMMGRVGRVGSYLGSEIILAVPNLEKERDLGPVLIAEATQPAALAAALADLQTTGIHFAIQSGLFVVSPSARQIQVVLALRQQPGSNPFTSTPLYARIWNAYREGIGWFAAADLRGLISANKHTTELGLADADQLVIEQKTGGGDVSYRAVLGFNKERRGMMSWIAQPAPMGALDFVSPNAYGVAAIAVKDPALIMDDLMKFFSTNEPGAMKELEEIQRMHRIDIRHDLAAPLGGEFVFAVDGPILPTPAWKVIIEVYDPARLQNTIQWAVSEYNREAAAKQLPIINLSAETAGGKTFYTIGSPATPFQIHYTFWTGYLVAGPSRPMLIEAMQYHDTGITIARSESFRSQLPSDGRDYVSGFVFQNLTTTGAPNLICLYGEQDRIIVSSKGMIGANLSGIAGLSGLIAQVQPK